jgi:two-component system response regulator NreC
VHAQDDDGGLGIGRENAARRLDAIHVRHRNVHHDHVRQLLFGEADTVAAIRGFADHRHIRLFFEQRAQAVAQGRSFLTRKVSRILQEDYIRQLEQRGLDDSYDLLTDREREVLQMVAEGRTNKEVAVILNISLTTVETHRTHILQKLGLHSIPELILYAVRKGIIS